MISARAPLLPGFGPERDYRYCGNDVPNVFRPADLANPIGKGHRLGRKHFRFRQPSDWRWSAQWIYTLQDGFPVYRGMPDPHYLHFGCTGLRGVRSESFMRIGACIILIYSS